jgi:hypothetical protein
MKNFSRNTAAVLVVTLFTGLAVFSAIQLGGRLFGASTASAQAVRTEAVQTHNGNGYGYGRGSGSQGYSDPSGQSYSDPYGQSDSGSSGGQTYTCPATGCTASSCHATE